MQTTPLNKWLPVLAAFFGAAALCFWWLGGGNSGDIKPRVPGTDRTVEDGGAGGRIEGRLITSNGVPSRVAGEWPRFRGTNLDNISLDPTPLARSWGANGPKVLWNIEVGEGFAGAAISNGRVYVMDYDRQGQADALRCLSFDDGRELWRFTYPVKVKRNHGMSRTVPTVTSKYVVAMGPKCHLVCVDSLTGEQRWVVNLVHEFNAEVPPWYAGQCPLVDGDRVIVATGGDALVVALDLATGKTLWKSTNPSLWQMTHSSVMPAMIGDRRMYVYCGSGGVAAVDARDGAYLWETPEWKINIATVPSPVPLPGGRLFLSGGYNAGAMMLQVKPEGDRWSATPVYRVKPTVFGAIQHTPILYKDHLMAIRQDGQFVCLNLEGKMVWESGPAHKFGNGPFILAQDMFFLMNDNGVLTLAEASLTGYKQLAQAKILEGPDAWGPMALAGGRLIIRDLNRMACLDVAAH